MRRLLYCVVACLVPLTAHAQLPTIPYVVQIMDDVATDETTAEATSLSPVGGGGADVNIARLQELAVYVVFSASTTAGVVEIESAHVSGYAGTWAPVATVPWVGANRVRWVAITGVHTVLRARISTAIADGTGVDVYVVGR